MHGNKSEEEDAMVFSEEESEVAATQPKKELFKVEVQSNDETDEPEIQRNSADIVKIEENGTISIDNTSFCPIKKEENDRQFLS